MLSNRVRTLLPQNCKARGGLNLIIHSLFLITPRAVFPSLHSSQTRSTLSKHQSKPTRQREFAAQETKHRKSCFLSYVTQLFRPFGYKVTRSLPYLTANPPDMIAPSVPVSQSEKFARRQVVAH